MKKNTSIINYVLIILFTCTFNIKAATPVDFTLEDRDRIISLEVKVEANTKQIEKLEQRMEQRFQKQFDMVQKRFSETNSLINKQNDTIQTFMFWIIGIMMGALGIIIGLLFWDRKTAVAPVEKKVFELDRQIKNLQKSYKYIENLLKNIIKPNDFPDNINIQTA